MKTIYNFLDTDTINMAWEEKEGLKGKFVWGVGNISWGKELLEGAVTGCITQTVASPQLVERIISVIEPHVPRCSEFRVQHYLWHPLSGINMHDDGDKIFGATIYLTPEWDINWGGLFVYADEGTGEGNKLQVLFPTYNSININMDGTSHMVTTLSPLTPYPRYTLQIWGYA